MIKLISQQDTPQGEMVQWTIGEATEGISWDNSSIIFLSPGLYQVGYSLNAYGDIAKFPAVHGWIVSKEGRVASYYFPGEGIFAFTGTSILNVEAGDRISILMAWGSNKFIEPNPVQFWAKKL